MIDFQSLSNHFLIAMPGLADPNFHRTVTYICEHTSDGAMGLTINRALDITLTEILEQSGIAPDPSLPQQDIFLGGPVQNDHGFVIHSPVGHWDSTLSVTEDIGVSSSRDILTAIAENRGPEHRLIALGYAGWGAGQLEREMAENSWLSTPANAEILFQTPITKRWTAAAKAVGVDLSTISSETGHA